MYAGIVLSSLEAVASTDHVAFAYVEIVSYVPLGEGTSTFVHVNTGVFGASSHEINSALRGNVLFPVLDVSCYVVRAVRVGCLLRNQCEGTKE